MKEQALFSVYTVQQVSAENVRTRTLVLDRPLTGAYPGQYIMAWLPGIGEKPFSLSGSDPLAVTICDVGPLSHALCQLQPGDRVWLRGPLGNGFQLSSGFHLLVGGGYGAAPLCFLAKMARRQGDRVAVCLGAKSKHELLLAAQFEALGCAVYLTTEDGSQGVQGLVTSAVQAAITRDQPGMLYACGPNGLLLTAVELARQAHIPCQLSFEALIRCGIGLCGSCELPEDTCARLGVPSGFLVCHDGPVMHIPNRLP